MIFQIPDRRKSQKTNYEHLEPKQQSGDPRTAVSAYICLLVFRVHVFNSRRTVNECQSVGYVFLIILPRKRVVLIVKKEKSVAVKIYLRF